MVNGKVVDCDGIFEDSNNGLVSGRYDHNERLIYTICVPGADYLTFQFDSFCTEKDADYLVVYNGRDTNGTKLGGPYSGSVTIPNIRSTDSCVTFYFQSDKSVSCYGWKALWESKTLPLPNPKFRQAPAPSCSSSVIRIRLDQTFHCDSIGPDNFTLGGVLPQQIQQVIPINCNGKRETDSFELRLSPGLNKGGGYRLDFEAVKYDYCDSPWALKSFVNFQLTDCPIDVELSSNRDTICEGECTWINTLITGGDPSSYQFQWNQGINRKYGPVKVCPLSTTTYTLKVSDANSLPGQDSITIYVKPKPQSVKDTTLCQSNMPFNLAGSPSGGRWAGKGISNPQTGSYDARQAGAGLDTITYLINGCRDTSIFTIRAINAGRPNTVCPSTSSFSLWSYSPAGGTWSGQNVQPNGVFTPPDTGRFTVTYTWNGCTDDKEVWVLPISVSSYDTVCLSKPVHDLKADPLGGIWSGPGLRNNWDGKFYPSRAGTGDHMLIYRSGQCRDTVRMHVIAINAGPNLISCPFQDSFQLSSYTPLGGVWKGRGIQDTLSNWYNPAFAQSLSFYNDTLEYEIDGCTAKRVVYVRHTRVYDKYKEFCREEPEFVLNWAAVRNTPGGGRWSGAGINGGLRFESASAGPGLHKLYYTAYGCTDSTEFFVHPPSVIQNDTQFCITDPVYRLHAEEAGGYFKGPGVVDSTAGLFLAQNAGVGQHTLYYFSKNACVDSIIIRVQARPVVKVTPPTYNYCHRDSLFGLKLEPAFGALSQLTGAGVVGQDFNPAMAGAGNHWIKYRYGTPTCYNADSVRLSVMAPLSLKLNAEDDSLCPGENTLIQTSSSGGIKDNYNYRWQDDSKDASLFAAPSTTTTYWAVLEDGCSDPDSAAIQLLVHPAVKANVTTSEIRCFGSMGFAEVVPQQAGNFTTTWFSSPPVTGMRLNASVGLRYRFSVKNDNSGCSFDSSVVIPGFEQIRAYFITNPSENICLNNLRNTLNLINLSTGGIRGYWDMGDGVRYPYDPALNPEHAYSPEKSSYRIVLYIENEGGCADSFERIICMTDSLFARIPNAFSPDGDGINDEFRPMVIGATEYELRVFNRWGELMFQTTDPLKGWNGEYLGTPCHKGAYFYTLKYKGKKTVNRLDSGTLLLLR